MASPPEKHNKLPASESSTGRTSDIENNAELLKICDSVQHIIIMGYKWNLSGNKLYFISQQPPPPPSQRKAVSGSEFLSQ